MARGNNCVIVVAGQATAVTNATIAGIIDEAGKGDMEEVYGASSGISGIAEGKLIDMGALKRKTIEGLRRTPGSALPGRHKPMGEAEAVALLNALRQRDIGTLFLLGGLPIVALLRSLVAAAPQDDDAPLLLGVPLSTENDVPGGDHTPGYGSSARLVATAARDAGRAAAAGEEPISVLEVPGQHAGWLAGAAALARDDNNSAPHAILVPERAVQTEALVEELQRAYHKYGYVVAVTTESVKDSEGNALDGAGLSTLLGQRLNQAARFDKPGSLARVTQAAIARADAEEAYDLGGLAVRLAADEMTNYLVTRQRDSHTSDRGDKGYKAVDSTAHLDQISDGARVLPPEFIAESGTQISQSFIDWARPLIGGALPEYTNLS